MSIIKNLLHKTTQISIILTQKSFNLKIRSKGSFIYKNKDIDLNNNLENYLKQLKIQLKEVRTNQRYCAISLSSAICDTYSFTMPQMSSAEIDYYLEENQIQLWQKFCPTLELDDKNYKTTYIKTNLDKNNMLVILVVIASDVLERIIKTIKQSSLKAIFITSEHFSILQYLKSESDFKQGYFLTIENNYVFLHSVFLDKYFIKKLTINSVKNEFESNADRLLTQLDAIIDSDNFFDIYLITTNEQQAKIIKKLAKNHKINIKVLDFNKQYLDYSRAKDIANLLNTTTKNFLLKNNQHIFKITFKWLLMIFIIHISLLLFTVYSTDFKDEEFNKIFNELQLKQNIKNSLLKNIKQNEEKSQQILEFRNNENSYFIFINKLDFLIGRGIVLESINYDRQHKKIILKIITKEVAKIDAFLTNLKSQEYIKSVRLGQLKNIENQVESQATIFIFLQENN